MINKQNLSYSIHENKIPISQNLRKLINEKKLKKIDLISRGDDYQILFTSSKSKSRIINKLSKSLGIKISKIGKICTHKAKSQIYDEKNRIISFKNDGYYHNF